MRVIFAGTPEFSVPALAAILTAGHEVVAVYTQPDRQAGRGRKTKPGPVKQFALDQGLTVEQPVTLKQQQATIRSYQADVMVVVAYGIILPKDILQIPRYGCLNIHASLLPRWRGAAPIQRAIEAGDKESGVTIRQMDSGLDTGEILALYPIAITPTETGQTLHDRLSAAGARAIVDVLGKLQQYQEKASAQQDSLACYAKKIAKQEGILDWTEHSDVIERRIRAFSSWTRSSRLNLASRN